MKSWSLYKLETGELIGRKFSSSEPNAIELNPAPEGHGIIEGHHDHLSKRVDIETGEVVEYQPPKPSNEHEWNATTKRWQLTKDAEDKNIIDLQARAEIKLLENQQARAMREFALGMDGAKDRLKSIDDKIIALRAKLKV